MTGSLLRSALRPRVALLVSLGLVTALIGTLAGQFHAAAADQSPRRAEAGFPVDDAWIHQVYARSLAATGRLDYNPGVAEAGQSSLLWGFVLAPVQIAAAALDVPVGAATRVAGALVWIGVALAAAALVASLPVPGALFGGFVAALLVALDPALGYAAASGMEPLLLALFLLLTLRFAIAGRPLAAGVCAGLATIARPEGAIGIGFALLAALLRRGVATPRDRVSAAVRTAVPAAVPPLAWMAFCLHVTGRPMPSTWYAKQADVSVVDGVTDGAALLAGLIADAPHFQLHVAWLFFGIGLIAILARCHRQISAPLLLIVPAYVIGVALTREMPRPEAFFWKRYLDPMLPMIHALTAVGYAATGAVLLDLMRKPSASAVAAARISEEARDAEREDVADVPDEAEPIGARASASVDLASRAPPAPVVPDPILAVVLFLLMLIPLASTPEALRRKIEAFGQDVAVVDTMNVAAALWVRDHAPADAVVAAQDAGAIRYFGEREVLDVIGLNDHRLITAGMDEGSVGPYLMRRRPSVFFLLDPDPGAVELRRFAELQLGLTPKQRFAVDRYTPFLQDEGKAILVLGP